VYEVCGTIESVCRKTRILDSKTVSKRYLPQVYPVQRSFYYRISSRDTEKVINLLVIRLTCPDAFLADCTIHGGYLSEQPWVHDRLVDVKPPNWNYTATWMSEH
jgi:hypothetical protein